MFNFCRGVELYRALTRARKKGISKGGIENAAKPASLRHFLNKNCCKNMVKSTERGVKTWHNRLILCTFP